MKIFIQNKFIHVMLTPIYKHKIIRLSIEDTYKHNWRRRNHVSDKVKGMKGLPQKIEKKRKNKG